MTSQTHVEEGKEVAGDVVVFRCSVLEVVVTNLRTVSVVPDQHEVGKSVEVVRVARSVLDVSSRCRASRQSRQIKVVQLCVVCDVHRVKLGARCEVVVVLDGGGTVGRARQVVTEHGCLADGDGEVSVTSCKQTQES